MKLKPLEDRIVIRPLKEVDKSSGGILIPDSAKEKPLEGFVVAIGPGKFSDTGEIIKMTVKKGDNVLYGKYSGNDVTIDDEELIIIRESDLFGIINNK